MRWLTNFYDFKLKWTATAGIRIHLTTDWHSWWISKMQSGREDTLEEQYAIKFWFKLGENATETYGMLQSAFGASCKNRAWVFEWYKRFMEGRESVRDDERCGRSKEVNTPELISQRVRVKIFFGKRPALFKSCQWHFPPGQCISFMCVLSIKVPLWKSLETYLMNLVCFLSVTQHCRVCV